MPIPASAEVVLHIGGPKTGSSAIQRHACLHAADLRHAGFLYPPHGLDANGVSSGHGDLFTRLLGREPTAARRVLARHLSDARRGRMQLVLSTESVYGLPAEVVAALPTAAFHVVCFLRHPLDAIASHHNQGIKRHADTFPLAQAAEAILAGLVDASVLSGRVLLDWLRICGPERMTVLPYIVAGGPIEARESFLGVLGLPPPPPVRSINRSYTPAAAAFKRLVNALPRPLLVAIDEDLDCSLQAYSDRVEIERPAATEVLGPEVAAALEASFRGDVERLEAAFGLRLEVRTPPATARDARADTPAAVWEHVRRDPSLAARVRDAVAAAGHDGLPVADLAALIG